MSYWDVLPLEMQVYILRLRDNQALIDHRESLQSRALCDEIHDYAALREKWGMGHIQVKPKLKYFKPLCDISDCRMCGWVERSYPQFFGYYVENGEKKRIFLDYSYENAMYSCDYVLVL